jgi:phosphoglycolate phosphatase-like HAD superfamily hydrolase
VPGTTFDVFVFDFDGTLVQSAAAKRKAFFELFRPDHAPAVETVLAADPDASRFAVIPMIYAEIARRGLPAPGADAAGLIEAYARKADAAVAAAPEVPGAGALLERLSGIGAVYVVSMTPHDHLLAHLKQRTWARYITAAFGYPNRKVVTVASLLAEHGIAPARLLVVGDGPSDEEAAASNGCCFHRIVRMADLLEVPTSTQVVNV